MSIKKSLLQFLLLTWAASLGLPTQGLTLSSDQFWTLAKPINPSNGLLGTGSNIFQFTVPTTGNLIKIRFTPFNIYTNSTTCTTTQGVIPYGVGTLICITSSQSGKTYGISQSALYQMMSLNGKIIDLINCVKMQDGLTGASVFQQTACTSSSCSYTSTASLTLTTQGSCTPPS